jgi:hypothetical protein
VAPYTHVLEYDGGALVASLGGRVDIDEFAAPLRRFNGTSQFALTLWRLPDGMDYDDARRAGQDATEYLQAAGSPDAITVEIRRTGGSEWGADWVRYVVGHANNEDEPLDVPVTLPHSTEMINRAEVFGPDEAADLFVRYYTTGDIPAEYALRPAEGFTRDGRNIDLRNQARPL